MIYPSELQLSHLGDHEIKAYKEHGSESSTKYDIYLIKVLLLSLLIQG